MASEADKLIDEGHDAQATAPVWGRVLLPDGTTIPVPLTAAERDRFAAVVKALKDQGDPDADEVAALGSDPDQVRAFLAELDAPDDPTSPLTDDERATLTELMVAARERGDDEAVDKLATMADDPAAFRTLLSQAAS